MGFTGCGKAHSDPQQASGQAFSRGDEINSMRRALQAAEKVLILGEIWQKHTSGAEACVDLIGFIPGMNPRPTARTSFSAACLAPEVWLATIATFTTDWLAVVGLDQKPHFSDQSLWTLKAGNQHNALRTRASRPFRSIVFAEFERR